MTTINAPTEPLSGPLVGVNERNDKPLKGDKTNLRSMVTIWDRTEHQLRPHESFKPEALRRRDIHLVPEDAPRTPKMAKPPSWSETPGMPCVPLDDLGPGEWDLHWDPMRWRKVPERVASERAAALCAGCPVRTECLEAAMTEERGLSHHSRFLVRGGMTPKGRAALARADVPARVVTTGYQTDESGSS